MTTTKAKLKFDPLDPLQITRELSDDENAYRERVRTFATAYSRRACAARSGTSMRIGRSSGNGRAWPVRLHGA